MEEIEAQMEMNTKKEMNHKFDKFLSERASIVSKHENDSIDIDQLITDKTDRMEVDIKHIMDKYDNPDKKM